MYSSDKGSSNKSAIDFTLLTNGQSSEYNTAAAEEEEEEYYYYYLFAMDIIAFLLQSLHIFLLAIALNYQRLNRSGHASQVVSMMDEEEKKRAEERTWYGSGTEDDLDVNDIDDIDDIEDEYGNSSSGIHRVFSHVSPAYVYRDYSYNNGGDASSSVMPINNDQVYHKSNASMNSNLLDSRQANLFSHKTTTLANQGKTNYQTNGANRVNISSLTASTNNNDSAEYGDGNDDDLYDNNSDADRVGMDNQFNKWKKNFKNYQAQLAPHGHYLTNEYYFQSDENEVSELHLMLRRSLAEKRREQRRLNRKSFVVRFLIRSYRKGKQYVSWLISSFNFVPVIIFMFELLGIFVTAASRFVSFMVWLPFNEVKLSFSHVSVCSIVGSYHDIISWTLLGLFLLQQFPIFITSTIILFSKRVAEEGLEVGPTIFARLVLGLSLLFGLPNAFPLTYWFLFVHGTSVSSECIMYVASLFDVVVFCSFVHHLLLFIFVRLEYKRNQEAAMLAAMQRTQVCISLVLLCHLYSNCNV